MAGVQRQAGELRQRRQVAVQRQPALLAAQPQALQLAQPRQPLARPEPTAGSQAELPQGACRCECCLGRCLEPGRLRVRGQTCRDGQAPGGAGVPLCPRGQAQQAAQFGTTAALTLRGERHSVEEARQKRYRPPALQTVGRVAGGAVAVYRQPRPRARFDLT